MRKHLATAALILTGAAAMVGIAAVAPPEMTPAQPVPAAVQSAAEADMAGR